MSDVAPCTPCCAESVNVQVPGIQGADGADGSNGISAFTTTTADFVIPAVGANVTPSMQNSDWMAIGMNVVFDGPATFTVVSLPNSTSAILTFLGYANDLAPGVTISTGAKVSPAGTQPALNTLSVYAAGTAYSLTNTAALLDFGTTDPSIVINEAGTWLILARVRYDYNAATFAAVRTVTTKLRRTNNTAADLTNGSGSWKTDIITTLTYTAVIHTLPPVIYSTLNSDDLLELWGSVNTVPSAGSLDAVEAEIVLVKLS